METKDKLNLILDKKREINKDIDDLFLQVMNEQKSIDLHEEDYSITLIDYNGEGETKLIDSIYLMDDGSIAVIDDDDNYFYTSDMDIDTKFAILNEILSVI